MTTRTFSQSSLARIAYLPPAKRGPGFRTVSVASYSSSSTSSDESVEVPDDLNSKELLLFAGFDDHVAEMIWQSWNNRISEERPDYVVQAARHYIRAMAEKQDAIDGDDDWHTALRVMGISDDMRQRIMNPEFTDIRLTGSASYWALDILQEAFDFLSVLSDRIDKKYKSDNINRTNTPDESKKPRPAIRGGRRARTGTSSASNDTPTPSIDISLPPKHIDGRTMLFKGGSESRLSEAIDENRGLLIGKLYSTAPTDFHPSSNELIYLTKHHDVALLYARYKAECLPPVKAAVLHIAIPNQLIGDGREIYGDHWRDLIWNSRNKKLHARGIRLPGHLNQYLGVDVLVSNLCSDSTEKITRRMEDKSELTVSKLPNGGKASQHVIQTLSRQTEIANQTVGYVWISPYTPGSGSGSK